MIARCFIVFFLVFTILKMQGQKVLKGSIVERDSTTAMPFVYIINKSNGNGTMSDNDGKFYLGTNDDDTLVCSYVGYAKLVIPVKKLKANDQGEVKLVMSQMIYNLREVTVSTFKIKPYERDYMNDIIDKSRIKKMDYATSPISALYMRYSKEGRQITKLAQIFEEIMIEEQVQKKLSREILVRLTKDENIDYDGFRKYCYYVNNYYIIEHDGVDLYTKVLDCYRKWKSDKGVQINREGKPKSSANKDAHRAVEEQGEYRAH